MLIFCWAVGETDENRREEKGQTWKTVERLHPGGPEGSKSERTGGGVSGDLASQNKSPHRRPHVVGFKPEEEEEVCL